MKRKDWPSIDDDLEWITADQKKGGIPEVWYKAEVEPDDPEDKERFKTQLENNTRIWRALRTLIARRYQARKSIDLEKPNLDERFWVNQGYRAALQDIYRLLPTKEKDT